MSRADAIIAAEEAKQQIRELLEATQKPPRVADTVRGRWEPWLPPPGRMELCDRCHQDTDARFLKNVPSPDGGHMGFATLCPRCLTGAG